MSKVDLKTAMEQSIDKQKQRTVGDMLTARIVNILLWVEREIQGKGSRILDVNALTECKKQGLVKEDEEGDLKLTAQGTELILKVRHQDEQEVVLAHTLTTIASRTHLVSEVKIPIEILDELNNRQWICFNDYEHLEITPLGVEKIKMFRRLGEILGT